MIISQWKGVQYAIFKQSQIRGFTNPKSGIYKPEVGDLQAQSRGFTMVKLHKTSSNGDIHGDTVLLEILVYGLRGKTTRNRTI